MIELLVAIVIVEVIRRGMGDAASHTREVVMASAKTIRTESRTRHCAKESK